MTAIVGLIGDGQIYMGADSAGTDGWLRQVSRADKKVFKRKGMLFGFTSSFRMGQLLQYKLDIPLHDPDKDTFAYMVENFVEAVRTCLKAGGYARKDNEKEEAGTFLVGYKERLFRVDSDYQVGESTGNYDTCGCGSELALGSLYATAKIKSMKPRQRVLGALAAAQEFSAGVRAPFHIEVLDKPKGE